MAAASKTDAMPASSRFLRQRAGSPRGCFDRVVRMQLGLFVLVRLAFRLELARQPDKT